MLHAEWTLLGWRWLDASYCHPLQKNVKPCCKRDYPTHVAFGNYKQQHQRGRLSKSDRLTRSKPHIDVDELDKWLLVATLQEIHFNKVKLLGAAGSNRSNGVSRVYGLCDPVQPLAMGRKRKNVSYGMRYAFIETKSTFCEFFPQFIFLQIIIVCI